MVNAKATWKIRDPEQTYRRSAVLSSSQRRNTSNKEPTDPDTLTPLSPVYSGGWSSSALNRQDDCQVFDCQAKGLALRVRDVQGSYGLARTLPFRGIRRRLPSSGHGTAYIMLIMLPSKPGIPRPASPEMSGGPP